MDFTGKVALVTGGGNGIGRATSAAFACHGAKVVVVDRDGAGAEATAGIIRQNGGDAIAVTADVTKSKEVKAYVRTAIEKYGQIDCFFNNAGIEGMFAATAELALECESASPAKATSGGQARDVRFEPKATSRRSPAACWCLATLTFLPLVRRKPTASRVGRQLPRLRLQFYFFSCSAFALRTASPTLVMGPSGHRAAP